MPYSEVCSADNSKFLSAMEKYDKLIWHIAHRFIRKSAYHETCDLVQVAYVTLWKNWDQSPIDAFDTDRFKNWFCRVASNAIRSSMRGLEFTTEVVEFDAERSTTSVVDKGCQEVELRDLVDKASAELSAESKIFLEEILDPSEEFMETARTLLRERDDGVGLGCMFELYGDCRAVRKELRKKMAKFKPALYAG